MWYFANVYGVFCISRAVPSLPRVPVAFCGLGPSLLSWYRLLTCEGRYRPSVVKGVSAASPEGVELVEVSMLLGHSELRVTADLYSHLQQQTAARAAKRMEHVLQLAKDA